MIHIRISVPLALACVLAAGPGADAGEQPTLKVQAVDVAWLPLPGLRVRVTPVASCKTPDSRPKATLIKITDREGFASFDIPEDAHYRITIGGEWGLQKTEECVELGKHFPTHPTAYVQLRVSVVIVND